jgi:hypothetical protein
MRKWALWLIHHNMAWLLKSIVILTYPLQIIIGYWDDALEDVKSTLRSIDIEAKR